MTLALDIRKRIGGFQLAVAFEAPSGITALFGPSGAGKTQTLRCIAGLERPDAGVITVNNRPLFDRQAGIDIPARERRVGYMFQQYALFPHLRVAQNIGYGLHRLPRRERDARIAAMLELVGLAGFEHRYPRELSGGQQQRVALARALAPMPDVLLLDEPFSAVDATVRAQLRGELRRIQEQTGIPMLLVTHDATDVIELASQVVLVESGRVVCSGSPRDMLPAARTLG